MKTFIYSFVVFASILVFSSCGNSDDSFKVAMEPSEEILRDLNGVDFSIVLNDMDISEKEDKTLFQHKYHILKVVDDSLVVDSLDWKPVNKAFFEKNEDNLGMEIVSYHNGNLSRVAQPVGFGWAIGNKKYGQWEEETKDSTATATNNNRSRRVWRSHAPSLLFWYWMLRRPAYQNHYTGYTSARRAGKAYYGTSTSGSSTYGTNSTYQKQRRPSFYNRRSTSSRWKSFTSSKKSRSSSRYKGGSSTRSRSGGIGK